MAYHLTNAHTFTAEKVSASRATGNAVDDIIACASPAKKRLKQTFE